MNWTWKFCMLNMCVCSSTIKDFVIKKFPYSIYQFLAHYAFYTVCSVSSAPHFLGRNSWLIPIWVKSIMGICQNIGLLENDGKLNICQCIRKDRKVLPRAGLTQNPWAFEFCHNSRKKWENDSDDWLENERSTYLKFQYHESILGI